MKVIAYTNDAGGVSVITPIANIEEVAKKDVPPIVIYEDDGNGVFSVRKEYPRPYFILEDTELPSHDHRAQWAIKDNAVVVDPTIALPIPDPDWDELYSRLLAGDLAPILASLKTAARLSTVTNWNLTQITFAITETRIEQALKTCLDELKDGGYIFIPEYKTLWNNAVTELNFSPLVRL